MVPSPIALFVYNRLQHTKRTIQALCRNKLAEQSRLFIFSDSAKTHEDSAGVDEVRQYIRKTRGFKEIKLVERPKNLGLAVSIITGVTEIIERYNRTIVLEDDIVTSPDFLSYINRALDFYENEIHVFSITGYNHPLHSMPIPSTYNNDIYFNPRPSSWGWATWKQIWKKVDWDVKDFESLKKDKNKKKAFNYSGDDKFEILKSQMEGRIDSWAIRWDYCHFKHQAVCVFPVRSLVDNIGLDGTGMHCGQDRKHLFRNNLIRDAKEHHFISYEGLNTEIMNAFRKVYRQGIRYKIDRFFKKALPFTIRGLLS